MQNRSKKIIFLVFFLFMQNSASVLAYIDPGTAGLVFNSFWSYLLGFIGTIGGIIALRFITPLKKWFNRKKR